MNAVERKSPFTPAYQTDWTVAKALNAYLEENGFTRESYDAPWVWVSFWWLKFPLLNPPSRRTAVRFHDLHHVATGYGTDPAGEAEISAWEVRRGLRGLSLFVRGIVTSGFLLGFLHSPKRTLVALKRSPSGDALFHRTLAEDYDGLLSMTVGELRTLLDLPADGIASEYGLHSAAPVPA